MSNENAKIVLDELKTEGERLKGLKKLFDTQEGLDFAMLVLRLGNFGGVIKGDFNCGAYSVASQVWIELLKAAPEAAKKIIDINHNEFVNARQEQFKQAETQLKEVD